MKKVFKTTRGEEKVLCSEQEFQDKELAALNALARKFAGKANIEKIPEDNPAKISVVIVGDATEGLEYVVSFRQSISREQGISICAAIALLFPGTVADIFHRFCNRKATIYSDPFLLAYPDKESLHAVIPADEVSEIATKAAAEVCQVDEEPATASERHLPLAEQEEGVEVFPRGIPADGRYS